MWKSLFIENTTQCNLNCPSCKRNREYMKYMSQEVFDATMSKLPDEETKLVTFFWRGEPTFDRRLPSWSEFAQDMGFITYTSTNTSTPLLHDEEYVSALLNSFNRICFCVDGYNQETLSRYRRGADWNTVLKNLEVISKFNTKCHKEMRVLRFRYNDGHDEEFIDMAKRYNMDSLNFGVPIINGKQFITDEEAEEWLSINKRYQRYVKVNNGWKHLGGSTCTFIPIVSVTGEIASCCYDWNISHSLGNVLTNTRAEINLKLLRTRRIGRQHKLSMCKKDCFIPSIKTNINVKLR